MLSREDIKRRLLVDVWLNDEIMNFYTEVLRDAGMKGERRKFCFLNCYWHESQRDQTQDQTNGDFARWYTRCHTFRFQGREGPQQIGPRLQSVDALAFVSNPYRNHWNNAIYDIHQRKLE